MSKTYSKTRILVECALMIAMGTVLTNIKIFTHAQRRHVTLLSMLPICAGVVPPRRKVGPVHRLCQRLPADAAGLLGTPDPDLHCISWAEVLLDYLVAFMALGMQSCLPVRSRTAWSVWPWAPLWQASCALCAAFCPVSWSGAT